MNATTPVRFGIAIFALLGLSGLLCIPGVLLVSVALLSKFGGAGWGERMVDTLVGLSPCAPIVLAFTAAALCHKG